MQLRLPRGDTIVKIALAAAAFFIIGLLVALAVELFTGSCRLDNQVWTGFFGRIYWDPVHEVFGALPFIYGTLLTSAIAILIGLPISLGVAVFISERLKSHRSLGYALGTLVDLLAAVPSVIYGLWGLLILVLFYATTWKDPYITPLVSFLYSPELLSERVFSLLESYWP